MQVRTTEPRFMNNERLGISVGILWAKKTFWMHRRVDIVEFCDATTLRFRIIIDLTIPEAAVIPLVGDRSTTKFAGIPVAGINGRKVRLLPIAMIDKERASIGFTLTDEEGRELSRIMGVESGELGTDYLISVATGVLIKAGLSVPNMTRLRKLLSFLCHPDSTDDGDRAWESLAAKDWGMAWEFKDCLMRDPEFFRWVHIFAGQYFLCVLLEGEPGQQRIIRFSFETDTSDSRRNRKAYKKRNLSARLGLKSTKYYIPASAAGDCASYHCEIIHPSGIDVRRIRMVAGFLESPKSLSLIKTRRSVNELRSHVVALEKRDPFGKFRMVVSLRVAWRGWLKTAALLGYGISLLMILSGFLFDTSGGGAGRGVPTDAGTLVGALLLGIGAACVTVLVGVNEHQLTAHLMQYFRTVMVLLVALVFGVGLALAFADVFVVKVVFLISGAVAFAGATVLALPWLQCLWKD